MLSKIFGISAKSLAKDPPDELLQFMDGLLVRFLKKDFLTFVLTVVLTKKKWQILGGILIDNEDKRFHSKKAWLKRHTNFHHEFSGNLKFCWTRYFFLNLCLKK